MGFGLFMLVYGLVASYRIGRCVAASSGTVDWQAYERGELGLYPQVGFQTIDLTAPLVHVKKWDHRCDNTSFIFLTPGGDEISRNKAFIVDNNGTMIWAIEEQGAISNLQVQAYKGDQYLTYWVGDDTHGDLGIGYYKMLDQTYTLAHTITALGGIDSDYHEFTITSENTALLTAYVKIPWDLSNLNGRKNGYIWDCIFQEINIEKDELIFEWKATNHFHLKDSGGPFEHEGFQENPWDWFHLNSVEKVSGGNYLISSRYRNTVVSIDGQTGQPLWYLGGAQNSLVDLSQGEATKLWNPRPARWIDSESAVLMLNNLVSPLTNKGPETHAVKVKVDAKRGSTKLLATFKHPNQLYAHFEGSVQILSNGHVFIGFGSTSVYSEFSAKGELLCDTAFAPIFAASEREAKPVRIRSYRVYKEQWIGIPKQRPNVEFTATSLRVSWNGATEVTAWHLAGRDSSFQTSESPWKQIGAYKKTGYETTIVFTDDAYASYQLTAVDSKGKRIRSWDVHPEGGVWELLYQDSYHFPLIHSKFTFSNSKYLATTFICAALLLLFNRRYLPGRLRSFKTIRRSGRSKPRSHTPMSGTSHQRSPLPRSKDPFDET